MTLIRTPAVAWLLIVASTNTVLAQSAARCPARDSLLLLGKNAFFRSVERGAGAIGERSLDGLGNGLTDASTFVLKPGVVRPRTAASTARAATFAGVDASLAEPLIAYVDSPDSEGAEKAFNTFLAKATKILFEAPSESTGAGSVGLVLEGGRLFNRGADWSVDEMANEKSRQKLEQTLFGDGPDLMLGKSQQIFAAAPFFKAPVIVDARDVDRNNIGLKIRRELELRDLWFKDYRGHLAAGTGAPDAAQITVALTAGWPTLQKFWAFKRTEAFINQAHMTFDAEMRAVYERANAEELRPRECDVGAKSPID